MSTLIRDPASDPAALDDAVGLLRAGELVAFPTETVYGLGALAMDAAAVGRIFALKGRPADNPLIVHVASPAMARRVVAAMPPLAEALIEAFWPGPLALVLPRAACLPAVLTAGLETVAVRMPQHPVALALLAALDEPLAAPSANRSGRPSPTRAEHVAAEFAGQLALILDGGPAWHGLESTVLDLSAPLPVLLRPGAITPLELEAVIGRIDWQPAADAPARSPGLRHLHYAPALRLLLAPASELADQCRQALASGQRTGVLYRTATTLPAGLALERHVPGSLADYGRAVFSVFHEAEQAGLDLLVAETVSAEGLGLAIMDRLQRASAAAPPPVS